MLPDVAFCMLATLEVLALLVTAPDGAAGAAWFSLFANRLSLSDAMPPLLAIGALGDAADAADAAAADDARALLDMDDAAPLGVRLVALAGSVSLLKNISRLLCNCNATPDKPLFNIKIHHQMALQVIFHRSFNIRGKQKHNILDKFFFLFFFESNRIECILNGMTRRRTMGQ